MERQLKQAKDLQLSQEKMKRNELNQSRWHNALELLTKITEKEPQLESRVAAMVMLGSLKIDADQMQHVQETICRYIRLHAKDLNSEQEGNSSMRDDIDCAISTTRRITKRKDWVPVALNLSQAYLPKADFRGANLTDWILESTNFHHADFRGATLDGAVFDKATLSGAKFDAETRLTGASFCGCTMIGTIAAGAKFIGCNFVGARIAERSDFSGCDFNGSDVTGVSFQLAVFNVKPDFSKAIGYSNDAKTANSEQPHHDYTPPIGPEDYT